ncbi:hypothetical protein A3D77_00380 [Candidatus Gottesmanbacteria bacterium RIFCSPHIGHO2_02_FULL_39_11]|uniref:Uncharacterized protein n=1 Tax=Candidatus Gottesmanbacteria bacterium RIFCSPHIGHO2_02_FULL_39_11 TaxID=1798382 RepID=A0A1F5ZL41_9BACT|nr:MAG: hypothetical protein A3D77_00380 [Candidatus Gottesmanbacteria bacterium RIFCSPHIGHO2_02_FULL_39_11]
MTLSPSEYYYLTLNSYSVFFLTYFIPIQSVGYAFLIFGSFTIVVDRFLKLHTRRYLDIIAGIFSGLGFVSLILLIINGIYFIVPTLNLYSQHLLPLKSPHTNVENIIHVDINGFMSGSIPFITISWLVLIAFLLSFYFYLLWQQNLNLWGRFLILIGFIVLLVSLTSLIAIGIFLTKTLPSV